MALGLLTDDSQIKAFDAFVQCCTHAYPTGDIERVEAASDWCAWLWYLDNTYDDDMEFVKQPGAVERLMAGMLEVWHNGRPPDSPTPLERFTCDLRTRLLALSHGNPSWFARFVSSVTSHLFQGSLPVALNYADRRTPEVADYELIREYDSGVYPCLDVIELVHNCFLPDSTAADPRVQRLRRLTTRVVAFINDLVSYQNEVLRNRNPNNLLNVLMRHRGLDFDGARSTAVEMVNRDVVEFCRLKASLLAGRSATRGPMRAYVTGMKSWMSGSLEWSLGSARYCAPDSPFPELRTES